MKRIVAFLLAFVLAVTSLCACSTMQEPADTSVQSPNGGEAGASEQIHAQNNTAPAKPGDSVSGSQTQQVIQATGDEQEQAETLSPEEQKNFVAASLHLTEVMPDNRNLVLGHGLDWVEIYNPDDAAVELRGYYLTDDKSDLTAMSLAGRKVPAGGYLVIPLDGKLQLSEAGGTVWLVGNGSVISELTFDAPVNGESFGVDGACKYPTPGFANNEAGYLAYCGSVAGPDLVLNEVLSSNGSFCPVDGMYYDLVEIKNVSDHSVSLSDYYLTDRWESTKRYRFPDVALGPGEFFIVYCSGDTSLGAQHAPFRISSEGQSLYLAYRGEFVDALVIPGNLKKDESYGRSDNVPMYLSRVTIGAENSDGILNRAAAPCASVKPGVYESEIRVELIGEGTIYYTLDGSRPTRKSKVYSGPISIKGVRTIRTFCVGDGEESPIANFAYAVGAVHDLPILSIAIPSASKNALLEKIESSEEYEAVATLFENGQEKFTVPFGMRLHGNDSRKGKKKNFQMRFRSEYGAGKLKYALFPDRDFAEFDSLLIKGGSEDWTNAMMRDELATSLANGTSALYTQAMKPVVMYLGGEYWGVHYIRERFSADYVASHLGVSPESVDILFSTKAYVQVGSNADFAALKAYCRSHDMSSSANYNYLAERIDVNSLVDWYIFRTYCTDNDFANIRRFRSTEYDGKWRWMFFDLDWSFYYTGKLPVSRALNDYGADTLLINSLLKSREGRDLFLTRYAYMMNTVLNEASVNARIDEFLSMIESEMPRDRERWGETMSGWKAHVEYIRKNVRDATLQKAILNDLKTRFKLSSEEMKKYFGDLYTE